MKKFAAIILALMLMLLASCENKKEEAEVPQESQNESSQSTEEESKEEEIKKAELKASFYEKEEIEENINEMTDEEFKDCGYNVKILVESDTLLKDVKFIRLNLSESAQVEKGDEVFTFSELSPEKPLLIVTAFPGDMPSCGISFEDTDGSERNFLFTTSGKDGSLIFEEF